MLLRISCMGLPLAPITRSMPRLFRSSCSSSWPDVSSRMVRMPVPKTVNNAPSIEEATLWRRFFQAMLSVVILLQTVLNGYIIFHSLVVCGDQQGCTLYGSLLGEQFQYFGGIVVVKCRSGLVGHQQRRAVYHRAGNSRPLHLSAAQLLRIPVG